MGNSPFTSWLLQISAELKAALLSCSREKGVARGTLPGRRPFLVINEALSRSHHFIMIYESDFDAIENQSLAASLQAKH